MDRPSMLAGNWRHASPEHHFPDALVPETAPVASTSRSSASSRALPADAAPPARTLLASSMSEISTSRPPRLPLGGSSSTECVIGSSRRSPSDASKRNRILPSTMHVQEGTVPMLLGSKFQMASVDGDWSPRDTVWKRYFSPSKGYDDTFPFAGEAAKTGMSVCSTAFQSTCETEKSMQRDGAGAGFNSNVGFVDLDATQLPLGEVEASLGGTAERHRQTLRGEPKLPSTLLCGGQNSPQGGGRLGATSPGVPTQSPTNVCIGSSAASTIVRAASCSSTWGGASVGQPSGATVPTEPLTDARCQYGAESAPSAMALQASIDALSAAKAQAISAVRPASRQSSGASRSSDLCSPRHLASAGHRSRDPQGAWPPEVVHLDSEERAPPTQMEVPAAHSDPQGGVGMSATWSQQDIPLQTLVGRFGCPAEKDVSSPQGVESRAPSGVDGLSTRAACRSHEVDAESAALAAAAKCMELRALHELRSFRHPPPVVCQVVETAATILGMPETSWSAVRRRLDAAFLQRLTAFNATTAARCPRSRVERILRIMRSSSLQHAALREKCPAVAPLASWCLAVTPLLIRAHGDLKDGDQAGTDASGAQASDSTAGPSQETLPEKSTARSATPGHRSQSTPRVAEAAMALPDEALARKPRSGAAMAASAPALLPRAAAVQPEKVLAPNGPPPPSTQDTAMPDLGGLFVQPPLWRLSDVELASVQDLRVGRESVGHVTFDGVTDCRGLLPKLQELLVVEKGEVIVYPDQRIKPGVGQGLNKPASVVLYGCMPKSKGRFTDPKARERYKQRVAQMTEDKGAIFEDYNCDDGTWKFRVTHF